MTRFLALFFALFATCALYAQTPYLVKDINSSADAAIGDSSPTNFVADGGTVYLSATTSYEGALLWKVVDGQASLVRDVLPHEPSAPGPVVPIGGGVSLFSGTTWSAGVELWRTDGTAAGTVLLKDTNPSGSGQVALAGVFNGLAYFLATTPANGREVWVSDGTAAGTHLLKDLNETSASSFAVIVGAFGSSVVLTGAGGLWITDGTTAGTSLIKGGISPRGAVIAGSKIFFAATDATFGEELWTSDGTEAGTQRALEMNPTTASSIPGQAVIVPVGARVIFYGTDGTTGNSGLWSSDGTNAGTQFLTTESAFYCGPACRYSYYAVANGLAYFNTQTQLWRTDGTLAGTIPIDVRAEITPFEAFGFAYYVVKEADGTTNVRRTDGTVAGITTAMTFAPGSLFEVPAFSGGKLYFRCKVAGAGIEPCVSSDGLSASLLANLNFDQPPSSYPKMLTAVDGRLFFRAREEGNSDELWRSDATEAGTESVTTFVADGNLSLNFDGFTAFRGALHFSYGNERWRSDGSVAGTAPAIFFPGRAVQPAIAMMLPSALGLMLVTDEGLWRSADDGTDPVLLAASDPENDFTFISQFVELAGRVYVVAGPGDAMLWESDGTPSNTRIIGTFVGGSLQARGDALYFRRGYTGAELWRSMGPAETEVLLGTFGANGATLLTAVGRHVFFVVDEGVAGMALWRTDGTLAGTTRIRGFASAHASAPLSELTAVGETLFFVVDDGVVGAELWRSDGTVDGTVLVKDIAPGQESSRPAELLAADGALWFVASESVHGAELWRSDGTPAGTVMVGDLAAGARSSSPEELVRAGRHVFFTANADATGTELWAVPLTGNSVAIGDARANEAQGGTVPLRFTVTREGDLAAPATVSWATEAGTATSGADFTAATGTLTFAAGESVKTIEIAVVADAVLEPAESLYVVLSAPSGTLLSDGRGVGILDDGRLHRDRRRAARHGVTGDRAFQNDHHFSDRPRRNDGGKL